MAYPQLALPYKVVTLDLVRRDQKDERDQKSVRDFALRFAPIISESIDRSKPLFRAAFEAIAKWNGCDVHVPILEIHGEDDQIVIPSGHIIRDAKHLVHFAKPDEVNRLIVEFIDETMRG